MIRESAKKIIAQTPRALCHIRAVFDAAKKLVDSLGEGKEPFLNRQDQAVAANLQQVAGNQVRLADKVRHKTIRR